MNRPFDALRIAAASAPDAVLAEDGTRVLTYRGALAEVAARMKDFERFRGRAGIVTGTGLGSLIDILALDGLDARVVLPPNATMGDMHVPADEVVLPGLALFTSGTTGMPKAVLHDWSSLAARVGRSPSLEGAVWFYPYQFASFAGMQVLLHALFNAGTLFLAPQPDVVLSAALRRPGIERVTHLSGTPTFLRLLLAARPERLGRLRQITLGGEIADQVVLDSLRAAFPGARLTHVFAASEVGVCFSVHDGLAGFPASFVGDPALAVTLKVDADGRLLVRSPHRMKGYLGGAPEMAEDGFLWTGDIVTLEGQRYRFAGRESERINVGGNKVLPVEIEGVLLGVPGVAIARVRGAANSLLGQIVEAEIVPVEGEDIEALRARIIAASAAALPPFKRPRIVHFLSEAEIGAAGKIARRAS